jgi:hypothetical protein
MTAMSWSSRRRFATVARLVALVVVAAGACTNSPGAGGPTTSGVSSLAVTTVPDPALVVVTGQPYCQVAATFAPDVVAYTDPASGRADASDVATTYLGALRAFDALAQVAPPVVQGPARLLRDTLQAAVSAAASAGWDLNSASGPAIKAAGGAAATTALNALRHYTLTTCRVDLEGITETDTTPTTLAGTPRQRLLAILAATYPALDDAELSCLEPRLPLDFDPTDPNLDPQVVTEAFAGCGIDPNNPSAPTTAVPAPFHGPRPTTAASVATPAT